MFKYVQNVINNNLTSIGAKLKRRLLEISTFSYSTKTTVKIITIKNVQFELQ